jgi:hypothetical protein
MDDINLEYDFGHGVAQSSATARVISTFDELKDRGSESSSLMMWSKKKNQWFHFNLGWTAIRVLCSESRMFALGADGRLMVAGAAGTQEENVTVDGENIELRDMCLIDDTIYAVGAGPCCFKREGPANWTRWDKGLESRKSQGAGAGFNSVSGIDASQIYAAGDNGEIWKCEDGTWQRLISATDLTLTVIRVVEPGLVYAGGQDGILVRGAEDEFKTIDCEEISKTVLGIQRFNGKLYVACANGLYALDKDHQPGKVHVAPGVHWTFGFLHAAEGTLWSFGQKHIFWTEDEEHWHNVTPSFTVFDPTDSGPPPSQSSCCSTGTGHKCD